MVSWFYRLLEMKGAAIEKGTLGIIEKHIAHKRAFLKRCQVGSKTSLINLLGSNPFEGNFKENETRMIGRATLKL